MTDYRTKMKTVIEPYAKKFERDGYLTTDEGIRLHYRTYMKEKSRANIVIFHGYTESSEKYKEVIYYFLKANFSVFIMDLRGHGYSSRQCDNPTIVYVDKFSDYIDDFIYFMERVVLKCSGEKPVLAYAHSMGAAIATGVIERKPDMFKCAVLSTPMFDPITYLPKKPLVKYLGKQCNEGNADGYIPFVYKGWPDEFRFDLVSAGSKEKYEYYYEKCVKDEHYRTFSASNSWLRAVILGTKEILLNKNLEKIKIPILVYRVVTDKRVKKAPIKRFTDKVKSATLVTKVCGTRHELHSTDGALFTWYIKKTIRYFRKYS